MLRCHACNYDLRGLARGPEAVTCPECGMRVPHRNGEAIPALPFRSVWDGLGAGRGRALLGPSVSALVAGAGVAVINAFESVGDVETEFAVVVVAAFGLGVLFSVLVAVTWFSVRARPGDISRMRWILGIACYAGCCVTLTLLSFVIAMLFFHGFVDGIGLT